MCVTFTNRLWETDGGQNLYKCTILLTWQVFGSHRCSSDVVVVGTGLQVAYLKELQNLYHCNGKLSTLLLYTYL
jgi:hypothetical protein